MNKKHRGVSSLWSDFPVEVRLDIRDSGLLYDVDIIIPEDVPTKLFAFIKDREWIIHLTYRNGGPRSCTLEAVQNRWREIHDSQ